MVDDIKLPVVSTESKVLKELAGIKKVSLLRRRLKRTKQLQSRKGQENARNGSPELPNIDQNAYEEPLPRNNMEILELDELSDSDVPPENSELQNVEQPDNINSTNSKIKSKLRSVATTVKDGTTKTGKHVAKTVKKGSIMTSKGIMKSAIQVGKGAVIASRATSRVVSSSNRPRGRPPVREPRKILTNASEKTKDKSNLQVVKRMNKISLPEHINFVKPTGHRSTKEKIMRNYSAILKDSISREHTAELLRSNMSSITNLDSWFLKGGAADIGVIPSIDHRELLLGAVCARALHQSSWREEWCGIFQHHVSFYPHFAKKPERVLLHRDITSIRRLDGLAMDYPMPGLHMLAVDTLGRVYYLAFARESMRESFLNILQNSVFLAEESSQSNPVPTHDPQEAFLLKSERWAGMQSKSASKPHSRLILNARRMKFDGTDFMRRAEDEDEILHVRITKFMESTLRHALTLGPQSALGSTISFLDMTCTFSSIPIHKLGAGDEALCFFINLYHCLVQHILLMLGPPTKSSLNSRMRLFCYEVGDDVFSLSEIESYVIRGKLSRPTYSKPPFVSGPKALHSNGLTTADYRVNFVLNQGFALNPPTVPILSPTSLDAQLHHVSAEFLTQVCVDYKKRIIYLPKICDVYRNDFGEGDNLTLAKYCLSFVRVNWEAVNELLLSDEKPTIKFLPLSMDFHSHLQELCEDSMAFRFFK